MSTRASSRWAGALLLFASCSSPSSIPDYASAQAVELGDEGAPCYGQFIDASGGRLAVSSLQAVFVYERQSRGSWELAHRIEVLEETGGFCIHRPVALSRSRLAFLDGGQVRSFRLDEGAAAELAALDVEAGYDLALTEAALAVVSESGPGGEDLRVFQASNAGWELEHTVTEAEGETFGEVDMGAGRLVVHRSLDGASLAVYRHAGSTLEVESTSVAAPERPLPNESHASDGEVAIALVDGALQLHELGESEPAALSLDIADSCSGSLDLRGDLAVIASCGPEEDAAILQRSSGQWSRLQSLAPPDRLPRWGTVAVDEDTLFLAAELTSVGEGGVFVYEP